MTLSAILAATAFLNVAPVPTPIGELELSAVLRDAYHHETGSFPRRELLASAWAHVALETGRGRASIHHNLGAVGWTGGPSMPRAVTGPSSCAVVLPCAHSRMAT